MIRKNYITDRWSSFCPNCANTDSDLVYEHEENEHTILEYECNVCGEHWEVEIPNKNISTLTT